MDFSRDCVFCKITSMIISAGRYGTRYDLSARHPGLEVVSFAPLEPVTAGHLLFVPSLHVVSARHNPLVAGLCTEAAARYGSRSPEDFNLIVNAGRDADQTVLHLHVHFIPRRAGDGLSLPWTKLERDLSAPVPG